MFQKFLIILGIIYILGMVAVFVSKKELKIQMLPRCAHMGFYSYFDNVKEECVCYSGYSHK